MTIQQAISIALKNISSHGDTDIFPFPFENLIFAHESERSRPVIEELNSSFFDKLGTDTPQTIASLTQVGYTGFRWATLIDPFWNAYYLALVVSIADKIEAQRLPESEHSVFSYRFHWQDDTNKLFKDSSWADFKAQCLVNSAEHPVVIQTDIADFYPRIYHHRIDNALRRLPDVGDTPKRIMNLLGSFTKNVSYGLPIGGPASRMLAELALNDVDKLLARNQVTFCRYADDYAIFCESKEDAYRTLVFLAEKLANEGLVLQKKKTRILSSEEFREVAELLGPTVADAISSDEQKLINISLRFDPYSPTAVQDYDSLKEAIGQIDILGILGREIAKTNVNASVARHAVSAISLLQQEQQEGAVRMLLDPTNLMTLAPVFVTVMRVIKSLYPGSSEPYKQLIDSSLCYLYESRFPLLAVEVNLAYFLQAFAGGRSAQKEAVLVKIFKDPSASPLIRRLVILTMAKWECHYWLSDIKGTYHNMTTYEQRAFILASYSLGDEGRHWREHQKTGWQSPEKLIRDWYASRSQAGHGMPI